MVVAYYQILCVPGFSALSYSRNLIQRRDAEAAIKGYPQITQIRITTIELSVFRFVHLVISIPGLIVQLLICILGYFFNLRNLRNLWITPDRGRSFSVPSRPI